MTRKPKPKVSHTDMLAKNRKQKLTSVSAQRKQIKIKCRARVEKIVAATDTNAVSFRMRTCPTAEQLADAERDPVVALLAFAINSGLGRFTHSEHLYKISELMKNPEFDSCVVPEEFKELVAEIEKEVTIADSQRIVGQHNSDTNKQAMLTACAACGMRAFDMGDIHHYMKPISQLDILKCTKERVDEIEQTSEEFR